MMVDEWRGGPQVGSCSRLGVLSLRDNSLWHLPTELGRLRRLHVLDVSGNRFLLCVVYCSL